MIDFVAIDFETANTNRDSACSVGLAVIENGKLSKSFNSLICPPVLDFNRFNVQVHGLTEVDVKDSPSFAEIWPHLISLIDNKPLVAHNAAFDMSVLNASAKQAAIKLPNIEYFCTLKLCKDLLPGLHNYRLGTLAKIFGLNLNHHEAQSDAVACAQIAIRLSGIADSVDHEIVTRGLQDSSTQVPYEQALQTPTNAPNPDCMILPANPDGRFKDMRFVLTGNMYYLTRNEAIKVIEAQGGKVVSAVSGQTDYVIVGGNTWQKYQADESTTGKLKKALEIQSKSGCIKILPEDVFYKLIES